MIVMKTAGDHEWRQSSCYLLMDNFPLNVSIILSSCRRAPS